MDKITFEEYCRYIEKGMAVLATDGYPKDKTIKAVICKTDKETEKTNERLFLYQECYDAIKDHPNEKDVIMKAIRKYEQTGKPFNIAYTYWEGSEEPPEDFGFIEINWGV